MNLDEVDVLVRKWRKHMESQGMTDGEFIANAISCFAAWLKVQGYQVTSYLTGKDYEIQQLRDFGISPADMGDNERGATARRD